MMKFFEKLFKVLLNNWLTTIILVVALVLFFIFLKDLIVAIIPAIAALVAYSCGVVLYGEYKKSPKTVNAVVKKAHAKKASKKK